jgi:hypothetical protein
MAARVGAYVVEVEVYTPKPDPAEPLLRRQYVPLEKADD